jgi:sugar/nucleoside kinase (ribokinase family)
MTVAKSVLIVGEINPDLVLGPYGTFPAPGKEVLVDDCTLALGSSSAICAVGLARLGTRVAFLGKVGDDAWGASCVDALAAEGVDVDRVTRDPALKTGVTVSITSGGERALVTYPGATTALGARDVERVELAGFDHVHVSSFFLQTGLRPACRALFRRARAAGLSTSLDPGFDPTETWGGDLVATLDEVDLFFPNEIELRAITGAADAPGALSRLANGLTRTVAKLGAGGCMTIDGSAVVRVPAFPVTPVDTTGAGDSFDAGFLHAFLAGRHLVECLRWGAACGALSTLRPGGTAGQPRAAEVERFLHRHP